MHIMSQDTPRVTRWKHHYTLAGILVVASGCSNASERHDGDAATGISPATQSSAMWASAGGISGTPSSPSESASIAVTGRENVFVAWHDYADGPAAQVYVRRFNGASWLPLGPSSATAGGISSNSGNSLTPAVAVRSTGEPIVAWSDDSSGTEQIYVRQFNGIAWVEVGGTSAQGGGISNSPGASAQPTIAVDGLNRVVVAWRDASPGYAEIYVRRLEAGSWQEMSSGSATGGGISQNIEPSVEPALSIDTLNRVVVAYAQFLGTATQIYVQRFSGSSWAEVGPGSASANGISNTPGLSLEPTVAMNPTDNPVVAWQDDASGFDNILLKQFNGSNWIEAGAGSGSGAGISGTTAYSMRPSIEIDRSGYPLVVWSEALGGGNTEVYAMRWSGFAWGEMRAGTASNGGISANMGNSDSPAIATTSDGDAIIAWHDDSSTGAGEIYVDFEVPAIWYEIGASSGRATGISNHPSSANAMWTNAEADSQGNLFVAWGDDHANGAGMMEIYLRWFDGSTWKSLSGSGDGGGVSNTPGMVSQYTSLAIDADDHPLIAYADGTGGAEEIYLKIHNGSSWIGLAGSDSGAGVSATATSSMGPDVAVDPFGRPVVAWNEMVAGNNEIYAKRFDGGAWVPLAGSASGGGISNNAGQSLEPAVAIDSAGNPAVAWYDYSTGVYQVYARYYDGGAWIDMGPSSSAAGGVSNSINGAVYPDIAFDSNDKAVMVWQDTASSGEIFVKTYTAGAWQELGTGSASGGGVSNRPGRSSSPSISIDAFNRPLVVWEEGSLGNEEVCLQRFDGLLWREVGIGSASPPGLSNNAGSSRFAAVTADSSGRPMVAWADNDNGDWQIYAMRYTKQTPEGPSAVTASGPFDNQVVPLDTPSFFFRASSPEGSTLSYLIQWDISPDFGAPNQRSSAIDPGFENEAVPTNFDPFTSGNLIRYTPPTAFFDGEVLWWRVRAVDSQTGTPGPWSVPRSLAIDLSLPLTAWRQDSGDQFATDVLVDAETRPPSADDVAQRFPYGTRTAPDAAPTGVGTTTMTAPSNAFADDGVYATSPDPGAYAEFTGFGVTIPAAMIITGIEVGISAFKTGNKAVAAEVSLADVGGAGYASPQALGINDQTDTGGYLTFGHSTDLWGIPWTPAKLIDGNFVVKVDFMISGGGGATEVLLDDMWVRVHYQGSTPGVVTSTLIDISDFPPGSAWAEATWTQGMFPNSTVYVEVLDSAGTPIAGYDYPSNDAQPTGFIDLSTLDPATYKQIYLRATLDDQGSGATSNLEWWQVAVTASANTAPSINGVYAMSPSIPLYDSSATTLGCDFQDIDGPLPDDFLVTFRVRAPDDIAVYELCVDATDGSQCGGTGVGTLVVTGNATYSAAVDWDPQIGLPQGPYDIECVIVDKGGTGETAVSSFTSNTDIVELYCDASDTSCDDVDQNCSGTPDDGYVSDTTCFLPGVCAAGNLASSCTSGIEMICATGSTTGADDDCNNIDENCDGTADDGWIAAMTNCGVGECASTGSNECVAGTPTDTCTAGSATGADQDCDGLDQNCDGTADDGWIAATTNCGVGECASTGSNECIAGMATDTCTAGLATGADQDCDGLDQNCDGTPDDGWIVATTNCGVGECASTGSNECIAGTATDTCTAGSATGADQDCDGLDQNCDGTPDDGWIAATTNCGVGECASTGSNECIAGTPTDTCTAGSATGADQDCDGLDQNCDGTPDDGWIAATTNCGVGECASTGSNECIAGTPTDTCTAGSATGADQECDGLDQNCDGTPDDGYVPDDTCFLPGVCAAGNVISSCTLGAETTCATGSATGADQECDGLDQNCDGTPDDGWVTTTTTCGLGECASTGSNECVAGEPTDSCAPGVAVGADRDCDGLDQNCDGTPDDGFMADTTSCGVGACASNGTTSCTLGVMSDSCVEGSPISIDDATCDGVDDNCDGSADEDAQSAGVCNSLATGICDVASCNPTDGACEISQRSGCCTDDLACSSPAACLVGRCDLGLNTCDVTAPEGCCSTDDDCHDDNPCTRGTCNQDSGACVVDNVLGCCLEHADCDDADSCSYDACTESSRCQHTPVGCSSVGPCGDDTACSYSRLHIDKGSASPTEVLVEDSRAVLLQFTIFADALGGTLGRLRLTVERDEGLPPLGSAPLVSLFEDEDGDGNPDPGSSALASAASVAWDSGEVVLSDLALAIAPASSTTFVVTLDPEAPQVAAGWAMPTDRPSGLDLIVGLGLLLLAALGGLAATQIRRRPVWATAALLLVIGACVYNPEAFSVWRGKIVVAHESDIEITTSDPGLKLWIEGLPIESEPFTILGAGK